MTDQSVRGRFIWHELMTPDKDEALTFYAESLGWKAVPWDLDPSYSMFSAPSGPLGGAVASDEAPRWIPYMATADLDATLAEAEHLGGGVMSLPTRIPNGSRYAVLVDPQGALFAVYEPGEEPPPETAPGQGDFSWHELAALDWRAAFDFYSALFGWERMEEHDMGPMGVYLLFGRNGVQIGGMFDKGEGGLTGDAYWLGYVSVANVQQTVDKIKAAGGTLAAGPMQVPGGAWIAQCIDPDGALFAVHAAPDAQAAPQSEAPAETPAAEVAERKKTATSRAAPTRKKPAANSKPASKKKPGRKKSADKKKSSGRKKAAAKKTGSAAGKKAGKKAAKKTAKKASKKASKKAAKRTAKKTAGKTAKKATKKAAKKTAKRTAKRTAKKAKKAAKKTTRGKKAARGKKKMRKKSSAKKAGSKRAGRKKARGAKKRSAAGKKASRRSR